MSDSEKKGIFWLVLMFISQQTLIIKPASIGFIDGMLYSWATKSSLGAGYNQLSSSLQLFFVAFIASFFFFEKNREKIFFSMIALTFLKYIIEIIIGYKMFEKSSEFEIKMWAIIMFWVSSFYVFDIFIKKNINNKVEKEVPNEQSEASSDKL